MQSSLVKPARIRQLFTASIVGFLTVLLTVVSPSLAEAMATTQSNGARMGTTPLAAKSASYSSHGIELEIDSMNPSVLTSSSGVKVTARVRNTSKQQFDGGTATLELGRSALDSRAQQQDWLQGDAKPANPVTKTVSVPSMPAGGSTSVDLALTSDELKLSFNLTTLPVFIHVDANNTLVASSRTFAEWAGNTSNITPVGASLIVPLTLPADPRLLTATGAERLAAWKAAIGPGSRIDQLLSTDPGVPVTWLIDPAILEPSQAQDVTLPKTGATVTQDNSSSAGASDSTTPSPSPSASASGSSGASSTSEPSASDSPSASASDSSTSSATPEDTSTVQGLAARLIAKLKARPKTQQVWFTPYGDPDLSALTSSQRPAGSDSVLKSVLSRPLSSELSEISTTVVAQPVSTMSEDEITRLRSAWKADRGSDPLIITPTATLDGAANASASQAVRTTASGGSLLGYDSGLSEALTGESDSDATAAQTLRAQTLAIYQEAPSAKRTVTMMAARDGLTPSRLMAVGSALKDSAWVSPQPVPSSAGSSAPVVHLSAVEPSDKDVYPSPSTPAIDRSDLGSLASDVSDLSRYAGALQDADDVVPTWRTNIDQIASTRWRGNPGAVNSLVATTDSNVASIPQRVQVVPSNINFFTDSGKITVTVKNGLARDIDNVTLKLVPRSFSLHVRKQPDPLTIPANGQASARADLLAQAAGVVGVATSLTAKNGVKFDDTTTGADVLRINARPTSTWIMWVLGIVAFTVFCYGLFRNWQKGARRRDELAGDIKL